MSTGTHKYEAPPEPPHSAFEEFRRDERRPAVLLLSALLLAATFFGLGIIFGRWTSERGSQSNATTNQPIKTTSSSPASTPATPQSSAPASTRSSSDTEHRFAILVATFETPEQAAPLIKDLQGAGYTDVRTNPPGVNEPQARYSVLAGHYNRDEVSEALKRMRAAGNPKFKNARVVEDIP